jgi:hypothetical protein
MISLIYLGTVLTWVREEEKTLQNIHIEKQITLITILEHSQLKELHQIYKTSYTIFV